MLQCGSTGGGQCFEGSRNKLDWDVVRDPDTDTELTPQKPPAQGNCKMRPLGGFDYWRIAPPFGNWGRALPRSGHVIHSNKIAASGMAALRAFNISRYPVEVWPQEGFIRTPIAFPGVDGPAPIGQPAVFPFVGPFPCTHLIDNNKTGLRGTTAFPAGVDLGSVFGGKLLWKSRCSGFRVVEGPCTCPDCGRSGCDYGGKRWLSADGMEGI